VLHTLRHCDGNRTHAARVLGLSVRTMRNKIRQYAADGRDVPVHHD
jgi:DNA-binding protein Fis